MGAPLKEQRQQLIVSALQNGGQVTVTELSQRFGVSPVTIRRDLRELHTRGLLQRAHGGAVSLLHMVTEPPVMQRMQQSRTIKESIGRAAAALVANGETVFIGSGSTTAYVARHLVNRRNLTVVTNALTVAMELARAPSVTVVVTGGILRSSELSLIGHITDQSLREVRVDKVIIGIPALSLEVGLTNDYLPEVMTDRAIIEMSPHLIIVADHTKFGRVASAYLAPLERVRTVVTDAGADPTFVSALKGKGLQVIIADEVATPS